MPEYAVIAGAILVAAYLIFQTVGNEVNALVNSILVAF
jgi:Flp pilus assembly pilin Flp